jgi:hypothetical protein
VARQLPVPQLAREIIDSNQRVLDALATEPPLPTDGNGDAAAERRRAARAARQLTRFTVNRAADARQSWQLALEILHDGIGGEEAEGLVGLSCAMIQSWLALAEKTRQVWQDIEAKTGATPEGLEELGVVEAEIKGSQSAAERTLAFLRRDRKPIDLTRLQRGQEDAEQGCFKNAEDVASRFQTPRK